MSAVELGGAGNVQRAHLALRHGGHERAWALGWCRALDQRTHRVGQVQRLGPYTTGRLLTHRSVCENVGRATTPRRPMWRAGWPATVVTVPPIVAYDGCFSPAHRNVNRPERTVDLQPLSVMVNRPQWARTGQKCRDFQGIGTIDILEGRSQRLLEEVRTGRIPPCIRPEVPASGSCSCGAG